MEGSNNNNPAQKSWSLVHPMVQPFIIGNPLPTVHEDDEGFGASDEFDQIFQYSESDYCTKSSGRALTSREYSFKQRFKTVQRIAQLEAEVKFLKREVNVIIPQRIKIAENEILSLRGENILVNQKLSALSDELKAKQGQYEELQKEREIQKQFYEVYHIQLSQMFKQGLNIGQISETAAMDPDN